MRDDRNLTISATTTFPGVGIEPTPPGSEPGIATNRNCPGVVLFLVHHSGRRIRTSIVGFKDRYPTIRRSPTVAASLRDADSLLQDSRFTAFITSNRATEFESRSDSATRVSCGSRTHLTSLEGWHLCRSVKDTLSNQFQFDIRVARISHRALAPVQTGR